MRIDEYFLPQVNSFRYERKFVISEPDRHEVETIIKLHPAIFSEIFQERSVNSIYLDSLTMSSYYDNEQGTSQRVKFRIRWYNRLFGIVGNPVLELKIKNNQRGSKISFPLVPFKLGPDFSLDSIVDVLRRSNIPAFVREESMSRQITLLVRYSRKYFQSADGNFRITIDWNMEYYVMNNVCNSFGKKEQDRFNTVLELKYSEVHDDRAHIITNHFPFRLSKSSKYVAGVDSSLLANVRGM